MPGTDGFTMACFKATDVPIGTKLYASPQAVAPTGEIAGLVEVEKIDCVTYERGWQEPADPIWRIQINGVCADFPTETWANNFADAIRRTIAQPLARLAEAEEALTASEAEATDLRHKLGELLAVIHRDGGHYQDFAGTEQTVADAHSAVTLLFQAQDERNDLRRNLEEARKALEHAAVAAYDEPAYLSPDGMERSADGLLPSDNPYDRGRYDARKAVENIARALKGSAQ